MAEQRATSCTACGWSSTAPPIARKGSFGYERSCRRAEDSPERQEALRLLADRLDLPRETLAGLAPARGGASSAVADDTRLLEAGDRLERDALAACLAHPSLVRGLGELTPGHFDSEVTQAVSRRARRQDGTTRS